MANYGKYRANPVALPAFVEIAKVDDEQQPVASDQFSGAVAAARTVTGMEIEFMYHPEGDDSLPAVLTTETVTFADYVDTGKHLTTHQVGKHRHGLPELASAPVNEPKKVEKIISDYLRFAGEARGANVEEIQTLVNASYMGGTLTVEHIGAVTVKTLIMDDASTLAGTRKTTKQSVSDYIAYVVGAAGDLEYNGIVDSSLGTYAYTVGNAAANDTAAATLQTDMTAALTAVGFPSTAAAAKVNDVGQNFCVTITAPSGQSLMLGTKVVNIGNTRVIYV